MPSGDEPGSPVVRSGFAPDRIIHLHPSARCNLSCSHCYSDSGPSRKGGLDARAINEALTTLRRHGYSHVSLSGGEPLMYPQLSDVVDGAKDLGYRVTLITNGLLVPNRNDRGDRLDRYDRNQRSDRKDRIDAVLRNLDGVAISFDGLAASHNAIRGRADAFERASAAVEQLSMAGQRVAAAVSVSRSTIPELPDLVEHLAGLGVCAVQIRPVAMAGRASRPAGLPGLPGLPAGLPVDVAADRARLFLISIALGYEFPHIRIRCDLAPASGLWSDRSSYRDLLEPDRARDTSLAQLVNPLVITENGFLKPIAYDFDSRFDIGSIESLNDGVIETYKSNGIDSFRDLMQSAIDGLDSLSTFVDWFDDCTRLSERFAHPTRAPALV